jgi:serpin B
MIKGMIKRPDLALAHITLVNALAFKGVWQNKFDPQFTKDDYPFRVTDDKTLPTAMMFQSGPRVLLHTGQDFTAVRLPYTASTGVSPISFIAYLPGNGITVQQLISKLSSQDLPRFSPTKLTQLGLPKMDVSSALKIFGMLKKLGYQLYGGFPHMCTGPNVVESILHNACIKLDENGTEAAAATAVIMSRSRPLHLPPSVIFDRPFIYSIVVDETGLCLFNGIFSIDK